MGDLYHIPHDDGKTYRLKKFVEYQHEVPEIHYRYLAEFVKRNGLCKNEAVDLCWYLSATYNELTAVLLHEQLKTATIGEVAHCPERLIFGSAAKWNKFNGRLEWLLDCWEKLTNGEPYKWLKAQQQSDPFTTYTCLQATLRGIPEFGRMRADLFEELVVCLKVWLGIEIEEPAEIDWTNGANLVSATFNIFYEDERANAYDKTKRLTLFEKRYLSEKLTEIQQAIKETYPEQNAEITMFIGKLCSFRNLFKGARYGGFHHDRELEWLKTYEDRFPEYQYLWDEAYEIRKSIFPHRFLGELNGWEGIRKERKKLWLTQGLTGAEP